MKIVKRKYKTGGKANNNYYYEDGGKFKNFMGQQGGMGMLSGAMDMGISAIPDDNLSGTGKAVAGMAQQAGSALMQSGNPIAMGAGVALKGITAIGTGIKQAVEEKRRDPLRRTRQSLTTENVTSNPLGLRTGGFLYRYGGKMYEKGGIPIKEYYAPSHDMGGLGIDSLMNPVQYQFGDNFSGPEKDKTAGLNAGIKYNAPSGFELSAGMRNNIVSGGVGFNNDKGTNFNISGSAPIKNTPYGPTPKVQASFGKTTAKGRRIETSVGYDFQNKAPSIGVNTDMNPPGGFEHGGFYAGPVGEIEKNEIAFDIKDLGKYILSDDPSMIGSYGHTPAKVASKVLNKLPGESAIDVKTTEALMSNLAKESEAIKPRQMGGTRTKTARYGSKLYRWGDEFVPTRMDVLNPLFDPAKPEANTSFAAAGLAEDSAGAYKAPGLGLAGRGIGDIETGTTEGPGVGATVDVTSGETLTEKIESGGYSPTDKTAREIRRDNRKEKRSTAEDGKDTDWSKVLGSTLKGGALLDQFAQLLEPTADTGTIANRYGKEAIGDLEGLGINMDPVRSDIRLSSNAQRQRNRQVGSFAVQQALDQNTYNQEIQALANLGMQEQEASNAYTSAAAQAKLQLGEADRAEGVRAQTADEMNQAAKAQMRDAFRQSLTSAGDAALASSVTKRRINEMTNLMNTRYADFGITPPDTWGPDKDIIMAKLSELEGKSDAEIKKYIKENYPGILKNATDGSE